MPQNVNINTDSSNSGIYPSFANGITAPSAFQAWERGVNDSLMTQKSIYDLALLEADWRFKNAQLADRDMFNLYKSQIDADFMLYKGQKDSNEKITEKHNMDSFALYKNQRDNFDVLSNRISALETKQAVNDAIEPWRAKAIDMKINCVAQGAESAISLEAERRCCADNSIVNYVNNTFYPQQIANIKVENTTTPESVYNPLCGCCGYYDNNRCK